MLNVMITVSILFNKIGLKFFVFLSIIFGTLFFGTTIELRKPLNCLFFVSGNIKKFK